MTSDSYLLNDQASSGLSKRIAIIETLTVNGFRGRLLVGRVLFRHFESVMSAVQEQKSAVAECSGDPIDFSGTELLGKGSVSEVTRGRWRGRDVAVKRSKGSHRDDTDRYLLAEIAILSRLNHPNIISLCASSTESPVFLVMECAEVSLYVALHKLGGHFRNEATIGWLLQCAQGILYMHAQKPKPIAHRDLKSPNLLLFNGGSTLKICDFGTAKEFEIKMTNCIGTAAWMPPEVFESSSYTEKCDVYSWAMVLWEVLARQLPFSEFDNQKQLLKAIHKGLRPPQVRNCPMAVQALMLRCWQHSSLRPSMAEAEAELRAILLSSHPTFLNLTSVGVEQQVERYRGDDSITDLGSQACRLLLKKREAENDKVMAKVAMESEMLHSFRQGKTSRYEMLKTELSNLDTIKEILERDLEIQNLRLQLLRIERDDLDRRRLLSLETTE
ncbi:Mitogen-activated protein kinase kinase kinase 7 [Halotydeus destructor]|nr:Mitogen-activated protein kinase kinase kinase 7 [Halotydeus destructor]